MQTVRGYLAAAALFMPLALGACTDTLRIASHAQLTNVDPITTTAYVTRSHGYMIYDTLFGLDENFEPKPQMVEGWTVSDDQLTWRFTLRDGLKWQDGTSVTAADCVASLQRWGKRDGMGQQLFKQVASLEAADGRSFVMTLSEPNGHILDALAKISSNVPFMMPARVAATDAWQEILDTTGSGPFIYDAAQSELNKKVYLKNRDYVPRTDLQSLAAGAKVPMVDRVEWIYFPRQIDAVQALIDGDVDYVESPSTQLVPMMEGNPEITVASTDPLGNIGMVRFNHLIPPFDKPEIRRAVLMGMKQEDYMTAALGDSRYWRICYSVYPCGTPLANEAGIDVMRTANIDAARAALQAAGYDGTPVVILNPTDTPVMAAFTKVTVDLLTALGMNVDVQDMTWAQMLERRNNRGAEGGWNMFHTWWIAADLQDPTAIAFSGDPETGWFGWASDSELERLRAAYATAATPEEQFSIATQVQERLWAIGAFGVLGQFFEPIAFRTELTGITSPLQFYWGVEK